MDTLTNYWISGHRLNLVQRISDEHSHLHGESAKRGGKVIITSSVVSYETDEVYGLVATTKSGTKYRLLSMDPAYEQWLDETS